MRAVLARLATPILQQLAAQAPSDDARYREHAGAGKLLRIDADRDGGDFCPFFLAPVVRFIDLVGGSFFYGFVGILKRKSGGGVPIGHFSVDYFFGIMRAHSSHVLMKVCSLRHQI